MPYHIEHTDTFAGEANYCWVRRYGFDGSEKAVVRAAKAACGLTGIRCHKVSMGGFLTALYPAGRCQVVFVQWAESTDPAYLDAKRIGTDGHPVEVEVEA